MLVGPQVFGITTLTKHTQNVEGSARPQRDVGASKASAQFRGRHLPDGMSFEAACEAERLVSEWERSSDQPLELAIALYQVFVGPASQPFFCQQGIDASYSLPPQSLAELFDRICQEHERCRLQQLPPPSLSHLERVLCLGP